MGWKAKQNKQTAACFREEGNKSYKEGNYLHAWIEYNNACDFVEKDVIASANRAQCELKLERFGEAIATCTLALTYDPNFVKLYYRRGVAYGGTLQYELAIKDFQNVLRLSPDSTEAQSKLKAAQSLVRYAAFKKAIMTDGLSTSDRLDLNSMMIETGPSIMDVDLDDLTDKSVQESIAGFKVGKRPPKRTVYDLIIRVTNILKEEPTMNELSIEEDNKTSTVCGDVHGQFFDVVHIFETNGYPSEEHWYLFNGDFVDRGNWSTEVILSSYILKLKNPKTLWLNRGNHETISMNMAYGFAGECKSKYGSTQIFNTFSDSFAMLPLACCINQSYFVVHGGIFSSFNVTLDEIRSINRFAFKQPPESGPVMEMLWADPRSTNGIGPSKRGIGHEFGPDITAQFVKTNKLKSIIRSHEVRQNGYSIEHDGKLITVFSAPNYCDSAHNKGAFINIDKKNELMYETFNASWHPDMPPMLFASKLMS